MGWTEAEWKEQAQTLEDYRGFIEGQPDYEDLLEKTKGNNPGKSWIESPFALPRLTDDKMQAKSEAFIAKYGPNYSIPSVGSIIHVGPRITISAEERAAHLWAQKNKFPSPLRPDQLNELTRRKQAYLSMISNPLPKWNKNATAILTALDNAEDALVTIALFSRVAGRFIPIIKKITDLIGAGSLLGSDIINLTNTAGWLRYAGHANKRKIEELVDKNPFTKKGFATRARKLKRTWPAFGEILEVAQTVDQMFGVGLCLGSIMGFFNQMVDAGLEQILKFAVNAVVTAEYPSAWRTIWSDAIQSANMIWAGFPDLAKFDLNNVTIAAESSLHALMPWWFKTDPLANTTGMNAYFIPLRKSKNPFTKLILESYDIDPEAGIAWPFMNSKNPTIEEWTYTYGVMGKDSFQAHQLNNQTTPDGFLMGHAASEITSVVTAAFSDDFAVSHANTAVPSMVKDLAQQNYYIPPATPKPMIDQLSGWAEDYERSSGQNPTFNEIRRAGEDIGINWMQNPPPIQNPKLDELYPGWNAMQDKVGELYEPD